MTKRTDEGVHALKNQDVTGMTEDKQEEVIERSGRAPRKDAAEEFYEEQGEQARETPSPGRDRER
jgi:tRNA U38,U39,U40 pseudouridine synthase TruA